MKKTPLNQIHRELGAKMVPFGGWDMPVQYKGIIAEHLSTRNDAGLFDVSHMGEIIIEGDPLEILKFLEFVTCNSVELLKDGQVQYNAIVNEQGGLVDDITLYKFSNSKYFICSNASNYETVYTHLLKYKTSNSFEIRNESDSWHQIAIQGPKANDIFANYLGHSLDSIAYYNFALMPFDNEEIIVSRTGYTGEDGFEIYTSIPSGIKLWNDLLSKYKDQGLVPVGLGARDTLRIEAKYPLYGHELTADRSPVESGIGWIVKEKSNPYLGYDRIIKDKKNGASKKTVGITLSEPGVLREEYPIYSMDGSEIGVTTSGTHSPSLKKSIGMALINKDHSADGKEIYVEIRGQRKKAIITTGKFIEGSVRKNK
ncbi:glycine cleavage system aminomethyltransferase GcvT [Leptospira sp. GIMC2001]|uniref:glycine cleavage system aminomethyltransferase GcvT n=1 Tax=Leptospira sp. GIMC2001 TaxID=1513297 RepID=UPI00234B9541|nr:glycine cleavage system aminomethyltransferase GcvT [Leptospira sp. GIMC2001]WCL49683.1 glycine cleavage system aminomethyltransferase GcvT [Leptospira sp. GIMC2001]